MTGAAFIDLDRTLLGKASGEVFSEAMRVAGLVTRRVPGERLLYGLFNAVGETLPSMALARQAVVLARGKRREVLDLVAEAAAEQLVEMVQPFAHAVISRAPRRRAPGGAGHHHAVPPGQAVRRHARPRRRDRHPLRARRRRHLRRDARRPVRVVGGQAAGGAGSGRRRTTSISPRATPTPTASTTRRCSAPSAIPWPSTPIRGMVVMAAARRWPVVHLDVPAGVRKMPFVGIELQRLALQLARPEMYPFARFDIDGVDNIPVEGSGDPRRQPPQLLRPGGDVAWSSPDRAVRLRFLGKKEVFDAPIVGQVAAAMGGIRVDRGERIDRAAGRRRRGSRRRRHGGDHAAGHDPAWAGVLRPRA